MTSRVAARLRGAVLSPIFLLAGLLGSAGSLVATPVSAIEIKITDPTPTYEAKRATCKGWDGKAYKDCKSAAKIDDKKSANGKNDAFDKSFKAWNATNAADKQWTLKDGGALPGGTLNVGTFDALAFEDTGGLEIRVTWDYTGRDKDQFFWTQGLYDNFAFSPDRVVKPMFEMDVKPAGCTGELLKKCPPLYPFQYDDRHFYDKPLGFWPDSFFDAVTFLSKADFDKREMTIYEGIAYGFALSATLSPAPEPSSFALMFTGLVLLAWLRWSRGAGRPAR